MTNCILNSGTARYTTGGSTTIYTYVETNNNYSWSYVFKNGNTFLYVQILPQSSGSATSGSFNSDGSSQFGPVFVTYNIKGYGIATVKEAANIGGKISNSSLNITKSLAYANGCKVINDELYNSPIQCIKYVDLKKATIYTYNIILYPYTGHQSPALGYIGMYVGNGSWQTQLPQGETLTQQALDTSFVFSTFTGISGKIICNCYNRQQGSYEDLTLFNINSLSISHKFNNIQDSGTISYMDAVSGVAGSETFSCTNNNIVIYKQWNKTLPSTHESPQYTYYTQPITSDITKTDILYNATTQHNAVQVNVTLSTTPYSGTFPTISI